MEAFATYHLFPSIGNSKRVNEFNFLAWRLDIGGVTRISPVERKRGHSLPAGPACSGVVLSGLDLDAIDWKGDVLLGSRKGVVAFAAFAVDDSLIVDILPSSDAGQELSGSGVSLNETRQNPGKVVVHLVETQTVPRDCVALVVFPEGSEWLLSECSATECESPAVPTDGESPVRFVLSWGGQARLRRPDLCSLLSEFDESAFIARAEAWERKRPCLTAGGETDDALKHAWNLHRVSSFEPAGRFPYVWESPGRGYLYHYFGHWDAIHTVLDLVWGDHGRASGLVWNLLQLQSTDGRMGVTFDLPGEPPEGSLADEAIGYTTPPLWSRAALEVFWRTNDLSQLRQCYHAFCRNIHWFEGSRLDAETGLFFHTSMSETGYDNMPRGEGQAVTEMADMRRFAAVDLNAQMAGYYEDMATMARLLGLNSEAAVWSGKHEGQAKRSRDWLWDEEAGFFFDLDLRTGGRSVVKSIAGFWPLVCGVADGEQARVVVGHLRNPDSFWAEHPVPSVALDEAQHSPDCWRGPVWASQNLWIILGLIRYGYRDTAGELALKTAQMVSGVLKAYGRIYEFHNPRGIDLRVLRRKGKADGPCSYYIGHNPLHAIVLSGLYGMRCTEQGLEICPQWAQIQGDGGVSVSFGESSLELLCSDADSGEWHLRCGEDVVFQGATGSPALIDYEMLRSGARHIEVVRE